LRPIIRFCARRKTAEIRHFGRNGRNGRKITPLVGYEKLAVSRLAVDDLNPACS
jgi:hypothetical protein